LVRKIPEERGNEGKASHKKVDGQRMGKKSDLRNKFNIPFQAP
jgi:hypothetical protein